MASIYRDGDSWRCMVRRKGYDTVTKTFEKKVDAERWGRKVEAGMDSRKHVDPIKQPARLLFERYSEEVSVRKKGAKWETNRLAKLCREAKWMRVPLTSVDGGLIQEWRNHRLTEISAASVNRELNLISSVFTHAIKEWRIGLVGNPVQSVKRPPKPKARNRRVRPHELEALWGHFGAGEIKHQQQYTIWAFEFSIETGLRMSEIARLDWDDIHLDEHWLHVSDSKNGDSRNVPMTPRAVGIVKALPKARSPFPFNIGSLGTFFRNACKKLGIVDLHFHDARHEACTRLSRFLTVLELAAVIGHRDLKSLMAYYNPTAQELAQKLGGSRSTAQHPSRTTAAFY